MNEMNLWLRFVLAVLATWRVTHLLAREDGPFDLIIRFRAWVGEGFIGSLMDCYQCLSIWVAVPMAFFVTQKPIDFLVSCFAVSGAACLLERIGQEAVVMQPFLETKEGETKEGETKNGMLWTEAGSSETDGAPETARGSGGHTEPAPPDFAGKHDAAALP